MPKSQQSKTVSKPQLVKLYRQAVAAGLPIELVHRKIQNFVERSEITLTVEEQNDKKSLKKLQKKLPLKTRIVVHLVPVFSVTAGLFLVSNAVWPILSYFVFTSPDLLNQSMLSPIPEDEVITADRPLVQQVQAAEGEFELPSIEAPVMLAEDLDYTNLSNWFPGITPEQEQQINQTPEEGDIEEYIIDIPAVNVEEARVKIGGSNLDKSLIHYPGTSNPGEPGSPVIFGHSVLRQFYNPSIKNPRRYTSIFSKIMTLKNGDRIYVTAKGVKYTYVVEAKAEVKPTDTFILEQNFDTRGLKLITCVPEGTFLRRGVIIARLESEVAN